ncbi:MAG: FAD-dependent oxidoreductase [Patescibacteria group bacterium]
MIYDLIIIGADSAGLTAGIYAGRKKLSNLILAKQVGGQSVMTDNIENFPGFELISGQELIYKIHSQAEKYGSIIKEGMTVLKIDKDGKIFSIKTENREEFKSKTVIIATGRKPMSLGIKGENEFKNKGVSYCSICDAPFFNNKDVAVIGGGNTGLESAIDLTRYAKRIYVLEYKNILTGDVCSQDRLRESEKVEFITSAEIKEIKGNNFVEKIVYQDKTSGKEKEIPVQGIFINIGWMPATDFVRGFLNLNNIGEIIINPKTMETSIKGVFAAGDVTDGIYKQNVIAAADGAKAALSVYNYLTSFS